MQGLIILNEYMEPVMRSSLLKSAIFTAAWLWCIGAAVIFKIVYQGRPTLPAIAVYGVVAALLIVCMAWAQADVEVGERHVVEAFMDARTTEAAIEEKYEILDRRGKILVLTERSGK